MTSQLGGAALAFTIDNSRDVTPGQAIPIQIDNLTSSVTAASETVAGSVELATQAETNAGTDDARAITPLKLASANLTANVSAASETVAGKAELATQAETNTGTDDARIVTPLKLASATNVVHIGGIETITGQKTLNDIIIADSVVGIAQDTAIKRTTDAATALTLEAGGVAQNVSLQLQTGTVNETVQLLLNTTSASFNPGSAIATVTFNDAGNDVDFVFKGDTDIRLLTLNGGTDSVGVGADPVATAKFQIDSTTKGFLPPRMTTAERDAITTPAAGLMIYNTTTSKLNVFTTVWEAVTSA